MQTGLSPTQLLENSRPETPMHPTGFLLQPYYMKRMRESRIVFEFQKDVDVSVRHFGAVLESLFDASLTGHKFWALRPAIQYALDKVIDDFGLGKEFRKLLKARWGYEDPWLTHVAARAYNSERREKAAAAREAFFQARETNPVFKEKVAAAQEAFFREHALKPAQQQRAPHSQNRRTA